MQQKQNTLVFRSPKSVKKSNLKVWIECGPRLLSHPGSEVKGETSPIIE